MIESESCAQHTFGEPVPAIGYGKFDAATAPTADADEIHGYSVNSKWFKVTVPQRLWICTDNTTGNAVWYEIPLSDYRNVRPIFDLSDDVTTTGTTAENLHLGAVPFYTFFQDGDEVRITYRGSFAANGNDKQIVLTSDGDVYFDSGVLTKNGGAYKIEVEVMRTDTDELDINIEYQDSASTIVTHATLSARDFELFGEWVLEATTPDLAGDINLHTAKAVFIPAAPAIAVPSNVTYLGDNVTYLGDQVTYT